MPVSGDTIRVQGLRQMNAAFQKIDKDTAKRVNAGLKHAAEPVKTDAERLAFVDIKRGRIPWWGMRIGVTKAFVYVAPKQRNKRRGDPRFKRPNLAQKLLDAELGGLRQNASKVEANVERTMTDLANEWGRGG
jgi:hypothetical protein